MDHKRRTVRHVYEEINKILFTYWDPIGMNDVLPKDEYEAYVGAVYGALANGTSEEGLVRLLTSLENEMIGLRAPVGEKGRSCSKASKPEYYGETKQRRVVRCRTGTIGGDSCPVFRSQ